MPAGRVSSATKGAACAPAFPIGKGRGGRSSRLAKRMLSQSPGARLEPDTPWDVTPASSTNKGLAAISCVVDTEHAARLDWPGRFGGTTSVFREGGAGFIWVRGSDGERW